VDTLFSAFALGNAAILTNACLLPLYPGLIAFLAGDAVKDRPRAISTTALGALVLLGVLTAMLLIGTILYVLGQTFGDVLPYILPLVYGLVIVFGILTFVERNPFARIGMGQIPILRNRYASAVAYGMLLAPMTLPCTGPIITSAFLLSTTGTQSLTDGLLYFLFFGLGFGYPLLLLPLFALPLQRRTVGWLTRNHTALNRASGILLIAVGIFGILTELVPQYATTFTFSREGWALYWIVVALLILAVIIRRPQSKVA